MTTEWIPLLLAPILPVILSHYLLSRKTAKLMAQASEERRRTDDQIIRTRHDVREANLVTSAQVDNTHRELTEIHLLVNSRLSDALARIAKLEEILMTYGLEVPDA